MTIDEAITQLMRVLNASSRKRNPYTFLAVDLAIEALKREKECRPGGKLTKEDILPGETFEEDGGVPC
jgi:hypothetical protein